MFILANNQEKLFFMRYSFTTIRLAKLKLDNINCWLGCRKTYSHPVLVGTCWLSQFGQHSFCQDLLELKMCVYNVAAVHFQACPFVRHLYTTTSPRQWCSVACSIIKRGRMMPIIKYTESVKQWYAHMMECYRAQNFTYASTEGQRERNLQKFIVEWKM